MFFFFKQKTAYEMRISDWSSDVCSSDLEHDEQRIAVGKRDRGKVEMAAVGKADLPGPLRAFERRDADHFLHDADLVRFRQPVGKPAHQRVDPRMRRQRRLVDTPQAPKPLVPQVPADRKSTRLNSN